GGYWAAGPAGPARYAGRSSARLPRCSGGVAQRTHHLVGVLAVVPDGYRMVLLGDLAGLDLRGEPEVLGEGVDRGVRERKLRVAAFGDCDCAEHAAGGLLRRHTGPCFDERAPMPPVVLDHVGGFVQDLGDLHRAPPAASSSARRRRSRSWTRQASASVYAAVHMPSAVAPTPSSRYGTSAAAAAVIHHPSVAISPPGMATSGRAVRVRVASADTAATARIPVVIWGSFLRRLGGAERGPRLHPPRPRHRPGPFSCGPVAVQVGSDQRGQPHDLLGGEAVAAGAGVGSSGGDRVGAGPDRARRPVRARARHLLHFSPSS